MQRDGIPGGLDSRLGYAMMLQELAGGIRAVNLKAVGGAAELLQQAKVMECGANKQELHIEFFTRLPAKLICPEEDAVGVVEEQRCAELPEKSGRLASQLRIGYPVLYMLKLCLRGWNRKNYLGPSKGRPCLRRLTDGECTQFASCCSSAVRGRSNFQKRTSIHLLSPKRIGPEMGNSVLLFPRLV